MRRNILSTLALALVMLMSASFSAYAIAGHTVAITSTMNATCNGSNDGLATAVVSGGVGPFGYVWNPGNITGATASNLSAGSYTVTVTDSSDMSTATAVATISEPTAITLSLSVTNVSCYGTCDGSASVTVSGGTAPYTYVWMPFAVTTSTISNLCAGMYTVTVTDANGCTNTGNISVSQPPQLVANASVTSATCNSVCDGAAGTAPTGTPPYTYLWSPGGQTTQSISGLCAGSYTVTVTDNTGCTDVQTMTVGQPPVLTVSAAGYDETCSGSNDGQAVAIPSGGTSPYTYAWAPGGGTTPTITNLIPGTYTVTVTDAYGCTATGTATVAAAIPITISSSSTPTCFASCSGSASSAVSGGALPFTYLWAPSGQNTSSVSNMCAGTYTFSVTDANNCTATNVVTINSNPSINPVANATPSSICSGNATMLQASATGATSYTWTPAIGLSATNIANPVATPTATTTYTATITDGNGCSETAIATITVNPNPMVVLSSTYASCSGSDGTAQATAAGNSPFTYLWSNSATTASTNGLSALTYSVTVTDVNGCIVIDSIAVQDSCGWVWPGDANEDLLVDNTDVLAIGLGFGFTGPQRANASLAWVGQPATDWNDTLPDGTNLKYTDCNGDGTIDNSDTLAVTQNYGLTHNYRLMEPVYSLSNPNLYLIASMDSAGPQTLVNIDIMLGEATMPVDSIYGIAYTLTFDPALIDTNASYISYTGSWLGTIGTDMMSFSKYFNASGYVDAAVVRTDHVNRSGFGKIGTFRIVTTDNLSGIIPLNIGISNVTGVTARMAYVTVNTTGDTIVLDSSLSTGITYHELEKLVSLYPNPAGSSVTFMLPSSTISEMIVADMAGRVIMRVENPSPVTMLDISKLATGMYHVIMKTSKGNINKKLQVIR